MYLALTEENKVESKADKIEVLKMAVSLLKNDINQMYIEYINNQITYTEYLNFKINTGKAIIYMEEHTKAMKV